MDKKTHNVPQVTYTRGNDLSGSLQGAGGIGGLLARTDNTLLGSQPSGAHAYYHFDGNGNVTCLIYPQNTVAARYHYDSYGNLLALSGPLAEANTYRFSSKEWEQPAGVYYYGFRYYEPNLQRWLNRDPIEEGGGINLYSFVFNRPQTVTDPFGDCAYGRRCEGGGHEMPVQPNPLYPPYKGDLGKLAACLTDLGINWWISGLPVFGPFVPEIDAVQAVFYGDLADTGEIDPTAAGLHLVKESTSAKMNSKGKWVKPPKPMKRWNRLFGWFGKLYEFGDTAKGIGECLKEAQGP